MKRRKMTIDAIIARRKKINETARDKAGSLVRSIDELAGLSFARRSVYCKNCWGLLPATVLMGMPARIVYSAIANEQIRKYSP